MESIMIPQELLDSVSLDETKPKKTRKYYGGRKRGNNKPIYYNQIKFRGWKELANAIKEEGLYNLSDGSIKDLTNPKRGLSKRRSELYPELVPKFIDESSDDLEEAVKNNKLVVTTKPNGFRSANSK